jgi:hypothetical protein
MYRVLDGFVMTHFEVGDRIISHPVCGKRGEAVLERVLKGMMICFILFCFCNWMDLIS